MSTQEEIVSNYEKQLAERRAYLKEVIQLRSNMKSAFERMDTSHGIHAEVKLSYKLLTKGCTNEITEVEQHIHKLKNLITHNNGQLS